MRKGFTLVELSIVLVIIGLLIGGILVAQSMIQTAKISTQVKQLQELDTAINNFRTKFNALPGDAATLGCTDDSRGSQFSKCGDGLITGDAIFVSHSRFSSEAALVWKQLKDGVGLYPEINFITTGFCSEIPTCQIPAKIAGKDVGIMVNYDNIQYATNWNGYSFGNFAPQYLGGDLDSRLPVIPCKHILALDAKLDDGMETSGNIRGGLPLGTGSSAHITSVKTNCDGYTSLNLNGRMFIKILSSGGQ